MNLFLRRRIDRIKVFSRSPRKWWHQKNLYRFRQNELKRLYLSCVRYMCTNSVHDNAYYFEFGCYSCNTLGIAWRHFRHHFNFDFAVFDSFQGLPEISKIDESEIFVEHGMCMSLEEFQAKVKSIGIDKKRLRVVKGFYCDTLTQELQTELLGKSIAVAMVDCDLYESTVPVLEFIRPFLRQGSIIIFDDWSCYFGSNDKGERRAFAEFTAKYPEFRFHTLAQTSEAIAFYVSDIKPVG